MHGSQTKRYLHTSISRQVDTKICSVRTTEYCSALNRKELPTHASTRMNPEDVA